MLKTKKIDLVILAGGKGTRVSKFLKNNPKPLLKFNGIFFLQYLINHFHKFPFQNTYILAGYRGNKIFQKYNNKIFNFIRIKCFVEKKTLGTGGALSLVKNYVKNDFVLINGDSILLENLNKLFTQKKIKDNLIYLTETKNYSSNSKLSNLSLSKNYVKLSKNKKYMNAGIYFLKKNFIKNHIPSNNCSLEDDILPKLFLRKKFRGIISKNFFLDIGTPNNFINADKLLKKVFKRKSAFFDRDGVLNYDTGYVHNIKKFKLLPNVLKSLKYLIKKNFNLFVVTNQAGIGKKKFTLNDFFNLHLALKQNFSKKGINFDDVQFSPFHKNSIIKKYRKVSNLRKPGNGMIKKINQKFLIDAKKSFFIGDQKKDQLAAKKSNLYFEYVKPNLYKQTIEILKKNK